MSALIKIHLTEKITEATIEGKAKDVLVVLVEFFHENPEFKKLFQDALKVEKVFALEEAIENEINKKNN